MPHHRVRGGWKNRAVALNKSGVRWSERMLLLPVASLLSGLLGILVATNQPSAVSNLVQQKTGAKIEIANPNDPIEREYLRLLELDDAAQAEVDRWLTENEKFSVVAGAGVDSATMRGRIEQRFARVEKAYKDFLERNPKHVKARVAYGSFLGDIGREDEAAAQYIKAREADPKDPAAWNNLARSRMHLCATKRRSS